MRLSMRRIRRYSAVAESTAQSTELPGRSCWKNAVCFTAAKLETQRLQRGTDYLQNTSFIQSAPCGRVENHGEPALLASCYRRCLQIAADHNVTSMAFPSISTGIYGYPVELAADLAIAEVKRGIGAGSKLREVIFCCFSARDLAAYQQRL